PICGGAWASLVNQPLTRCADGEEREACYVAQVDYSALGFAGGPLAELQRDLREDRALALGSLEPKDYPGFGNLGALRVLGWWQAQSSPSRTVAAPERDACWWRASCTWRSRRTEGSGHHRNAVKPEGGAEIAPHVEAMVKMGIPVLAHMGLTPMTSAALGGMSSAAVLPEQKLWNDARTLPEAGAYA